jgi:large subunit ribosomal protein L25
MVGEAAGVKQGGLVEAIHHELEVRCLPKDLPERISVDVSALNVGDSIHVGEVKLPEGVRAKLAADVVLLMCVEPKVEAEPEPAAGGKAAADAKAGAPAAGAKAAAPAAAKPAAKK